MPTTTIMSNGEEEAEKARNEKVPAQTAPAVIPPPQPGRTVLPGPVAQAVSLATRSTCLAIKAGTVVGSFGFDAARAASLSSLELGRGILGGILGRAGGRVVSRSADQLSREDAESLLETSLASLHHAMTQVVFWTAAGFEVTGSTISIVSGVSQLLLSSLDQFFGSTDSSRAIASIITLIRREFQNPATGVEGERVGVVDLVVGLCAMAFLQHSCRKSIEEENRRLEYEEIIWDVVVLNDGERVDVQGGGSGSESWSGIGVSRPKSQASDRSSHASASASASVHSDVTITQPIIFQSIEQQQQQQHESPEHSDDDDLPEIRLKRQIMRSLPRETTVSISTSVVTTKTITVDVNGPGTPQLTAPPGVEVIEERTVASPPALSSGLAGQANPLGIMEPTYRVVYRVDRKKCKSTTLRRFEDDAGSPIEMGEAEEVEGSPEDAPPVPPPHEDSYFAQDMPPPLPPKPNTSRSSPRLGTAPPDLSMTPHTYVARKPHDQTETMPTQGRMSPSRRPAQTAKPQPQPQSRPRSRQANEANQKRQRTPLAQVKAKEQSKLPRQDTQIGGKFLPRKSKNETDPARVGVGAGAGAGAGTGTGTGTGTGAGTGKGSEKKGGFRQALRIGSGQSLSSLWNKDHSPDGGPPKSKHSSSTTRATRAPGGGGGGGGGGGTNIPVPARTSSAATKRGQYVDQDPDLVSRSPSRSSYISVHERTRDAIISQTDTFSIHSTEDLRPPSPVIVRTDVSSNMIKSRSEKDMQAQQQGGLSPSRSQRRVKSHVHTPSLYSIATNASQTSLVLSSFFQRSAYSNSEALNRLRRTGMVEGTFPRFHILRNITRYVRFSSASYGSSFMKFMGISKEMPILHALDDTHDDVKSFAHHTESHTNSILLASFVDPQGGSDSTGSTNTGFPLVHYISLDHESKAVVLACRGTLGFEDILADMTCDYDELVWRGKSYKVHKGIHASARRLLYGGDGRVLLTLNETLDEFKDYGLVLCGHSLGGAVTALLGVMLSEPNTSGTDFITSAEPHNRLLTNGSSVDSNYTRVCLPPGRPIHVYAYGPPGTMSASLRTATRGLITTVVQGSDLVPHLSLGVLHDLQAVALAFKNDSGRAKSDIYNRVWQAFQVGLADRWYSNGGGTSSPSSTFSTTAERGDLSEWALSSLKTLRAAMINEKLLPPGEVFRVESTRVLRRDAFVRDAEDHLGRPARRVVLRYVRDVEARFREARFAATMLIDHSPGRYEDALNRLRAGVSEPDFC